MDFRGPLECFHQLLFPSLVTPVKTLSCLSVREYVFTFVSFFHLISFIGICLSIYLLQFIRVFLIQRHLSNAFFKK